MYSRKKMSGQQQSSTMRGGSVPRVPTSDPVAQAWANVDRIPQGASGLGDRLFDRDFQRPSAAGSGKRKEDAAAARRRKPRATADHATRHQAYYEDLMHRQRLNLIDDSEREIEKQKNVEMPGTKIYKRIVKTITGTKNIKLLPYQLRLVEMCLVPALPGIYGDDYHRFKDEILQEHGVSEPYNEVFFLSSRRMGKTLTLSMLACTLAMSIPWDGTHPMRLCVFSVTGPSAEQFIKECVSSLKCLNHTDDFEITIKATEVKASETRETMSIVASNHIFRTVHQQEGSQRCENYPVLLRSW
jgi:hypothetical protein